MGGYEDNKARLAELNSFGRPLAKRCRTRCELCGENRSLFIYEVPPVDAPDIDKCVMICEVCKEGIENTKTIDEHHWHCLNKSAWSEVPAVQVVVWRLLKRLKSQAWAQDLAEQLYLDEEIIEWAESEN